MRRVMLWILGLVTLVLLAGCGWVLGQRSIETPGYTVETSDGAVEIRSYPALLAAEVTRAGDRRSAANAGFSPLARYIFAEDRSGEKIAMTAPVTQVPLEGETAATTGPWAVRFLMPRRFTRETLPDPGPGVEIVTLPPRRVAVIRFPGGMRDPLYSEKEAELRVWMADRGLVPVGPPSFAYYNDPFTPGFLRRNEVMIPISVAN